MTADSHDSLRQKIDDIGARHGCEAVGVSVHDYADDSDFSHRGDEWFHAASTIKVVLLLSLYKAAESGAVRLDDRVHVRNRFRSIVDGSPYRIGGDRDGDSLVHRHIGRSMKLTELAHAMITRSSNLATNILLDFLGLEHTQRTLQEAGLHELKLVRGVEDQPAYDKGLNNEATANGLVQFFRLLREGEYLSQTTREQMLVILLAQEFNSMIPARLPRTAQVAHKTGEISTHCHDAGLVILSDRPPYALAILTKSPAKADQRSKVVAEISETIYAHLTA
jgi:beta-lactamase class A